jgi:uncharacterized protein YjbJ (UPF0337 family)
MSNGTNLDAAEHKKHDAPAHHAAAHAEEPKHEAHHARAHAPVAAHDPIETHWKALAHQMKEKWTSLTEDDLKYVDKTKSALLAKVKERTGLESETAERQLDVMITGLGA